MGRFLLLFLALAFFLVELEAKKRINKGNLRGWKPAFESTPKPFKNQPPTSTTQSPQPLSSSIKPQLSTPNDKLLRLKLKNFRVGLVSLNDSKGTVSTNYAGGIHLPTEIFKQLELIEGVTLKNGRVFAPSDTAFQMKIKLQDPKGKLVEWTMDENDLYTGWNHNETTPSTVCLIEFNNEDEYVRKWDKNSDHIGLTIPFFRPGCVLFDMEKKEMTLNKRLEMNVVFTYFKG